MNINLGCGDKHVPGFLGVDRYRAAAVEMLCDVERSLPFRDSTIDAIHLDNLIEHVLDITALVRELVRVARPGARISIVTPHFSSLASWMDPTHLHHLSYFSMNHYEHEYLRCALPGRVNVTQRRLSFGGGVLGVLGRLFFTLSPDLYERKLAFVFRASTLRYELRVEKHENPEFRIQNSESAPPPLLDSGC
jgi:SAM-dependent methyltransferase